APGGARDWPAPAPVARRTPRQATVLELAGASRHFKGLKAVQDVSFAVRAGEIVGLIGPNGAGKTTLLSMLSGFLPPSAGSIRGFGRDIAHQAPHRVARLGVVRSFQQTALCAGQTVAMNMAIASHMHRPAGLAGALL